MILFSRDIPMREILAESVPGSVLGLAVRNARRAYIFTHRIAQLALRHGDDFRGTLGRVMAHEVGHLVLPFYSHSDHGIMSANFGVRSMSDRDFSSEQVVAVRSTILANSSASSAPLGNLVHSEAQEVSPQESARSHAVSWESQSTTLATSAAVQ